MCDADLSSKKKLSDLKVKDLRQQLEKRNLDRTGNKTALVERLSKSLQNEGCNPDEYLFDVACETVKTPVKSPAVKRPSRKSRDNGADSLQDEGDVEDEDEEEKQREAEQENKKELNKDQDIQDQKQDVNTLNNPGGQKVSQYNGGEEQSSQVSVQLAPEKSQLDSITPSVAIEDATKLDKGSSKNSGHNVSVRSAKDANVAVSGKQDVESECHPVKEEKNKPSDNIENEAGVLTNDSEEASNSFAQHDVEKTVIDTDVNDAPSKRSDRESTETSTAATDEKSNKSAETSSQDAAVKNVEVPEDAKNLWVCGLSSKTRAADLKSLFSTYGKVINAKVATSAKSPSSRFGLVIMARSDCASACIEHLHNTEFQGEVITVEKTTRELHTNSTVKPIADSSNTPSESCNQQSKEDASEKKISSSAISNDNVKKESKGSSKAERTKKKQKEAESGKNEVKGEKKKSDGGEERKSRKIRSCDRIARSEIVSRGWREAKRVAYRRLPQRGRFYRTSIFSQRDYGRSYDDYRERGMGRSYTSRPRYSDSFNAEEVRLQHEKEMLRLEKEKIEIERLKLEKEKHRFEREQLELEKAELRARKLSQSLPERRSMKRPFDGHRGKLEGHHWSDRRRESPRDSMSGSRSPGRYSEYSHERLDYHKRSGSYEGRSRNDARPHLSGFSRHEAEGRMFARGRHDEPDEKRPREDWKGAKGRETFERSSSSSRGFPDRHGVESPSPWSNPAERELKFGSASITPPGQWSQAKSDAWGRMDGPPPKRWAGVESRGQIGHPANHQGIFGASGVIMSNVAESYPIDQFNVSNLFTRF